MHPAVSFPSRVAVALALVLPISAVAASSDNVVIAHSGRLLDAQDRGVGESVSLKFALYPVSEDRSGEQPTPAVWQATYTVTPKDGIYAVDLGDVSRGAALAASVLRAHRDVWLGVAIGDASELKPRMRIGTMPFAARADVASVAEDVNCEGCVEDAALSANIARLDAGPTFTVPPRFAPTGSGNPAPFVVAAGATGLVANLNAEKVGGQALADLDGRYAASGTAGNLTLDKLDARFAPATTAGKLTLDELDTRFAPASTAGGLTLSALDDRFAAKTSDNFLRIQPGTLTAQTGSVAVSSVVQAGRLVVTGAAPSALPSVDVSGVATFSGEVRLPTSQPSTCTQGATYVTAGGLQVCDAGAWKPSWTRPALVRVEASTIPFGAVSTVVTEVDVTIQNFGDVPATSVATAVTGAGYSKVSETCATTLEAGARCSVKIRLTPSGSAGARPGSLNVTTANGGNPSATLSGTYALPTNAGLGSQATPAVSCKQIKDVTSTTTDGLYFVTGGFAGEPIQVWCDMNRDAGGWTLVLQNNAGQTSPDPDYDAAVNRVSTSGYHGSSLTSFDVFVGVKYWMRLGTRIRLETGASPTSRQHQAFYDFTLDPAASWRVTFTNGTTSVGSTEPGFKTYHKDFGLTTRDHIVSQAGDCYPSYRYAWWYGSCWDGNFWGSRTGSHQDKAYWSSSGSDYADWGAIWVK